MQLSEEVRNKAAFIRLAVFDVDGVMTDGNIMLGNDGNEFKLFHVHDGLGLIMIQEQGINVAIISSRSSDVVSKRMSDLGIKHVLQGISEKKQALQDLMEELDIDTEAMAYVGDDLIDLPAMSLAGLSIAVVNARPQVISFADCVTTAAGGHGGVREVCDMLLEAQGKLNRCLRKYTELPIE